MTSAGGPTTPESPAASGETPPPDRTPDRTPDPSPGPSPDPSPGPTPGPAPDPTSERTADRQGSAAGEPASVPAGDTPERLGLPPLGAPRRPSPSWAVVVLLVAIGLSAGFLAKAPCLATYQTSSGNVALDWREGRQYTNLCYSDTIPLYGLERLSEGDFPYRTSWLDDDGVTRRYMEYPVLTGLLQYVVMRTTKAWVSVTDGEQRPDPPEVVVYFVIMAVVLALAWLAAVLATVPLLSRQRLAGVYKPHSGLSVCQH